MPKLDFAFGFDETQLDKGISNVQKKFDSLAKDLDKKKIGEEWARDLSSLSEAVDKAVDTIGKKVVEVQKKIDALRDARKGWLESGDGEKAAAISDQIDTLIKERTELLSTEAEYVKYKDKIKGAAQAAAELLDKTGENTVSFGKLREILGAVAGKGFKGLITAVKSFLSIGLVGVVNAISTAFIAFMRYLKGTEEGQRALAKVSGYLTGIFNSLKATASSLGKALFDAFKSVKPLVEAITNRVIGLVSAFNSLIKMGALALRGEWDSISAEFDKFKASLGEVWSGNLNDNSSAIRKEAEATSKLYEEREELKNQRQEWEEQKADLNYQIAEAEAAKNYARVNALNDQIYKKELGFLEQELDIEKQLVELKGEGATTADEDTLRNLRIAIKDYKATRVRSESRTSTKAGTEADKRAKKAIEQAKLSEKALSDLNAKTLENEEARISLIANKGKRTRAQIAFNYQKALEEIRKQRAEWELENQKTIGQDILTPEQQKALDESAQIAKDVMAKAIRDLNEEEENAQNQFLLSYGTYIEKIEATKALYANKMKNADTEGERLSLMKEEQKALNQLKEAYDDAYSLIFAKAESLSNDELSEAIEATQKAIKEARNSGDIQALTELYKKLREQQQVQLSRNTKYGFAGINQGRDLISGAQLKRGEAEFLSNSLERYNADLKNAEMLGLSPDKLDVLRTKIAEIEERIKALKEEAREDEESGQGLILGSIRDLGAAFASLGSAMSAFRTGAGGVLDALADIGDTFSAISSQANHFYTLIDKDSTPAQKGRAGLEAAFQLVEMIGSQIAENTKAQEEWNRTIRQAEHQLTMLNLDALSYKEGNIFGVEDPFQKAKDSAKQYEASMQEVAKLTEKLAGGKVQTDQKWGLNLKNAGAGAAMGAIAGSVIPGAGNVIGAAIGGAIGLIAGALSGKMKPVLSDLSSQYSWLFDSDTYELNPQIIADYEKLDDATKQIVDNWDEIKEKAEKAREELHNNLSEFAGDVGNELEEQLVSAWKSRSLYDSVDDFHDYVSNSIASIMQKQVFNAVYGNLFTQLQTRMEESFKEFGDQDIADDLAWLDREYQKLLPMYDAAMEQAQAQMERMGYAGFDDSLKNANASTGSFSTISETTGQALEGRMTAIQMGVYSLIDMESKGILLFENLSNLASSGNALLTEIRDIHIQSNSYLEDIARQTRGIPGMVEMVETIERNTNRL